MDVSSLIGSYLDATGWKKQDLAHRAGISPSTVTRLLHGRKVDGDGHPYGVGELVAIKIERATTEAYSSGETTVPPIRAVDLMRGPSGKAA